MADMGGWYLISGFNSTFTHHYFFPDRIVHSKQIGSDWLCPSGMFYTSIFLQFPPVVERQMHKYRSTTTSVLNATQTSPTLSLLICAGLSDSWCVFSSAILIIHGNGAVIGNRQ